MKDLVERLVAAIEAKEAKAQSAIPGPWRYNPAKEWHSSEELAKPRWLRLPGDEFVGAGPLEATIGVAATGPANHLQSMADAAFIADNDPADVLRRCAADREIVEIAKYHIENLQQHRVNGAPILATDEATAVLMTKMLQVLARGYGIQP